MTTKIYSKIQPDKLLHVIKYGFNISEGREDLIEPNNFLQCSALKLNEGKTFKPHKHIKKTIHFEEHWAQESWIVLKGKVKCILYDLDDTILTTEVLFPGDASFTLEGGHNYEILEDDTIIFEYKTGPYEGQEIDKIFIE